MLKDHTRTVLSRLALGVGAAALLATGADHLDEYAANSFSTIPTIGPLFVLNFIAATLLGAGLLLPLRRLAGGFADPLRTLMAISGIVLAATSLVALWISETSTLFGFMDVGFRATIIVAIASEGAAIIGLSAYLLLALPRFANFDQRRSRAVGSVGSRLTTLKP